MRGQTDPYSRNTALRRFLFWFLRSWSQPTKWVSESQLSLGLPGVVSGKESGSQHHLPRQRTSMLGERERPGNSQESKAGQFSLPAAPQSKQLAQGLQGHVPCLQGQHPSRRVTCAPPPSPCTSPHPRQGISCCSAPPFPPPGVPSQAHLFRSQISRPGLPPAPCPSRPSGPALT